MRAEPRPDVAVAVEGVSKAFRLPHEQVHTLKERALHPLRRRSFERLAALDRVSFEIERGEFFGIAGRNGSGKSTLLKCLAGIYRPDAGEIWMRGRMAPFIELGVGFNPDLTARDNVVINAIMLGLTPAEAKARYEAIVEFAELEEFVDLKLKNYSSGMQVRLAFAVMVHVSADVLLIDEVLAVGDAAFQRKCHDALLAAREEGRTILLVTHDMNAIQRFCHRAVLLERGRVIALGEPRLVARRYEEVNREREPSAAGAALHAGDGAAAIVDTWLEGADGRRAEALEHGRPCAIRMRVEFRARVRDPAFGLVVTDEQHRMVFATDSRSTTARSGDYEPGDRVDVSVSFDNVLASGRYLVSPQVAYPDATRRLMDHRIDAVALVVTGSREQAGLIDLPHELAIEPVERPAETAVGS